MASIPWSKRNFKLAYPSHHSSASVSLVVKKEKSNLDADAQMKCAPTSGSDSARAALGNKTTDAKDDIKNPRLDRYTGSDRRS